MVYTDNNRWDYQDKAINKIVSFYKDKNATKGLLVIPTGGGKTLTALRAINKLYTKNLISKKVLWVSHLKTLNIQTKSVISKELKNKKFLNNQNLEDVNSKLKNIDPNMVKESAKLIDVNKHDYDLIIIDEAHHSAATGYQKLLNSNVKVIGLTATPTRLDKKNLEYDDNIIFQVLYGELFKRKVIIKPQIVSYKTEIPYDIRNLSDDSEFDVLDNSSRNFLIAEKIFQKKEIYSKVIVFVRTKNHAIHLMKALEIENNRTRFYENIGYILGGDDNSENISNKDFIKKNNNYNKSIIVNCGVLTEGFDDQSINTTVMACPSQSTTYTLQCVGRALRRDPKKGDEQKKYFVQFVDTLPNITYRFENFWTFGEIEENLEPKTEIIDYSSSDELKSKLNNIIDSMPGLKSSCEKINFKVEEINFENIEDSNLMLYNSHTKLDEEDWAIILMQSQDDKEKYLDKFNYLSRNVERFIRDIEQNNYNIQTVIGLRGIEDNDRFLGNLGRRQNFWSSIEKSFSIIKSRGTKKTEVNRIYYYSFVKKENEFEENLKIFISDCIDKEKIYKEIDKLDASKLYWVIKVPFYFGEKKWYIIDDKTKIKIVKLVEYFDKIRVNKKPKDYIKYINEKKQDFYDMNKSNIPYEKILSIVNNLDKTYSKQENYLKIYKKYVKI